MKGCELKAGGGFVAAPQGTKLVPLTAYLVFAFGPARGVKRFELVEPKQ